MNFRERSYQKELLDRQDIPFADIEQNMKELDRINSLLGGHRVTCRGLDEMLEKKAGRQNELSVLEIGCGGGDNLRVIRKRLQQKKIPVVLSGVDINPACIEFAKNHPSNEGISFVCSDYRSFPFTERPDVIFSSLFCHHFTDDELVAMLQWMQQNCGSGFFINDLHRHPLAYRSIKWLTALLSKSYLVKNDAPLSVLRGFTRNDWQRLLQRAGLVQVTCKWQWAFRWLVTCSK